MTVLSDIYILSRILVCIIVMRIASFDIGTRNTGLCVYNTDTKTVEHLELIDLLRPNDSDEYGWSDQAAVFLVKKMIQTRISLFQRCDVIGIEKQMTRKMVVIQFALECLLEEMTSAKVYQVVPRNVKNMFDTSTGKHRTNKVKAIEAVLALTSLPPSISTYLNGSKKKDDLADAMLQAMYVAERVGVLHEKKQSYCVPRQK